ALRRRPGRGRGPARSGGSGRRGEGRRRTCARARSGRAAPAGGRRSAALMAVAGRNAGGQGDTAGKPVGERPSGGRLRTMARWGRRGTAGAAIAARLSFDDVSHAYDTTLAVDRVTLDIEPAEVVCLLGPSGCGK